MKRCIGYSLVIGILLSACSPQQYLGRQARTSLLRTEPLENAHVGISVYDPGENKYLFNYQGEKYFVPASNTKIATCYAAMKYLGDSLTGIRYWEDDKAVYLVPTGDPTLLHADYANHRVIDFLKNKNKAIYVLNNNWKENALGAGWSWGDYNSSYMVERSPLPVYGNVLHWVQENNEQPATNTMFESTPSIYSIPEMNWKVRFSTDTSRKTFFVRRDRDNNTFLITQGTEKKKEQYVPFVTQELQSALELLRDTVGREILLYNEPEASFPIATGEELTAIRSQPTDSLLRPLMHRSDNFFAEQALLMVSEARMCMMDMDKVIDSLLHSDLADLPQKPRWADGSGLSRYNLFTPQDFVTILNKMQQEFGLERLKVIFPTGGRGTLGSYYRQDSGYIYAKTGTLSGVVALSGYLITRKNRLLIFSVLVNNHNGSATAVRRAVEAFLVNIRNRY